MFGGRRSKAVELSFRKVLEGRVLILRQGLSVNTPRGNSGTLSHRVKSIGAFHQLCSRKAALAGNRLVKNSSYAFSLGRERQSEQLPFTSFRYTRK